MGLIGNLTKTLTKNWRAQRSRVPQEIRELIAQKRLDAAHQALAQLHTGLPQFEAERSCLEGEILFHEHQDERAAYCFQAALKEVPGMPDAHYGLSLVLAAQSDFDGAARHVQFALNVKRDERYYAQLGYCHLMLGNILAAESPLRTATILQGKDPLIWNNLGIVLRSMRQNAESKLCFQKAIELNPEFAVAQEHLTQIQVEIDTNLVTNSTNYNASVLVPHMAPYTPPTAFQDILELEKQGQLQQAIDACEAQLLIDDADCFPILLSQLYIRAGDADSAIETLAAYEKTHPHSDRTTGALGLALLQAQQHRSAEPLLRRAIAAQPQHVDYLTGLAKCLSNDHRYDEAAPYFEQAHKLLPDEPKMLSNLAANLVNQCRYDEARELFDQLTARGFKVAALSALEAYTGNMEEALRLLNESIGQQPNDPRLRFERGCLHLHLGNYGEGWDDYASRGLCDKQHFRMLPYPRWRGESLDGKRVVVMAEQGLGDQIMFASCLPDVLALNPAHVILEANERLAKTLARSFPECEVIASTQKSNVLWVKGLSEEIHYFTHLPDLPQFFRRSVEDFPRHQGYLKPDPERTAYWRKELQSLGKGPYLGVSWRGGTEHTRKVVRSMPPQTLLPLAHKIRATWVCLQYGDVCEELAAMGNTMMPLHYWEQAIRNLDEFAALISALDGVVSVCNTTVHFAGALGKPVWVMAPHVPEWRYGYADPHMPWYPTTAVVKQKVANDWIDCIEQIGQDLSQNPFA